VTTTTFLGDKPINRMGYGAMQLAGPGAFGPPRDPRAARAVLRRAIELGVDHIDTSQYYGPDVVNDLIRQALHPYPETLKLVTKVGWRRDQAGSILPAQRPGELRAGVEANLRSLRVERLDLVNLRLAGSGGDAAIPLEAQLSALEDLRREGKLDLIGLSNVERTTVERALALVDVGEIQNGYSIIDRRTTRWSTSPGSTGSPTRRSSRSARRSRAGRRTWRATRRSSRWPASTERRRRKSPWRGCWLATTGCCRFRVRARSPTSRKTWLRWNSSSITPISPCSIASSSARRAKFTIIR
jgi:hypothetical protein